ncbi:uncharacterized protein YfaP (DUF2135 family) [Kerstersia gyiorum]|uniref:Uncharacterized protein YfaP (DUF2135 family) n=2 Tax=Kerstersia gyiorum TaxID=206506 RepID=A0A4Q7MM55_9BURK|nr:uncharacterized protein YfaP (DUF2135 family) [Kerstersia gyiorum]
MGAAMNKRFGFAPFPLARSYRSFAAGLAAAATLSLAAVQPALAQQEPASLCETSGYVLGFFNGVWNDPTEAAHGMERLMLLAGDSHDGERVTSELFYNTSGKLADRPDVTSLEDVAEVFIQRSEEIDGVFAQRWEYFWSTLSGAGESSLWERLKDSHQAFGDAYQAWRDTVKAKMVSLLAGMASTPPTEADYIRHNARIQGLVTERKKLLLVAHSQGNLFVNKAYDEAVRVSGSTASAKVVHIATAAPTLNGEYTTVDIDLVIGGLRAVAGNTPAANLNIPFSKVDASGHKLIETYLDGTRAARGQVQAQMQKALGELQTPTTVGETGFFTVTLTWDGEGDVDLHTFEPQGAHVYYASRPGQSGYLDTDNVIAYGPEHYYASCDANVLQAGVYQIGINNYARAAGRTATVQLSSAKDGELLTRRLPVGEVRGNSGNNSPIPVFNVKVAQSAEGVWSVTPQ